MLVPLPAGSADSACTWEERFIPDTCGSNHYWTPSLIGFGLKPTLPLENSGSYRAAMLLETNVPRKLSAISEMR